MEGVGDPRPPPPPGPRSCGSMSAPPPPAGRVGVSGRFVRRDSLAPPPLTPPPVEGFWGVRGGAGDRYHGEIRVGGRVGGGRSRAGREATSGAERPDWVVVGAGSAGTPGTLARTIPTATASPHTPLTRPHQLDRRALGTISGRVGSDASEGPPPQQPARMARFQPPPRQESPPTVPRGPGITCAICSPKTQNA